MSSAREKVEAYWEYVRVRLVERLFDAEKWQLEILRSNDSQILFSAPILRSHHDTEDAAWQAAAEYTEQHREEVRQLEEEIGIIKADVEWFTTVDQEVKPLHTIYKRTLQRLEAALAEKLRGTRKGTK